jgi:hypothetical protein
MSHIALHEIKTLQVTGRGGSYVCPVRYEPHSHVKKISSPVIDGKASVLGEVQKSSTYKKVKLSS